MNTYHILVAEDNVALAQAITTSLQQEKIYTIDVAHTIETVKATLEKKPIHLILLDRMLGNEDSLDSLDWIRTHSPKSKIIFVSVKGTPKDRIDGLKLGANDYLSKPFDVEELHIRMKKWLDILEPSPAPKPEKKKTIPLILFGKNKVDPNAMFAENFRKEKMLLSDIEKKMLHYFSEHPRQLLSRDLLFKEVWGYPYNQKTRVIDNLILKFRKFFEHAPQAPKHFLSKRGGGYMFVP